MGWGAERGYLNSHVELFTDLLPNQTSNWISKAPLQSDMMTAEVRGGGGGGSLSGRICKRQRNVLTNHVDVPTLRNCCSIYYEYFRKIKSGRKMKRSNTAFWKQSSTFADWNAQYRKRECYKTTFFVSGNIAKCTAAAQLERGQTTVLCSLV